MSDPFLGEIRIVGFMFAPRGWAFCMGQILPISQNTALFSLLGTQFGGNGQSTFALPDLRGRVGIGQGQGPGLSDFVIGEQGGAPTVTLNTSEIPSHRHAFAASGGSAGSGDPSAGTFARPNVNPRLQPMYAAAPNAAGPNLGSTGGNQPHTNLQPYLGVNYVIALQGIFPPRS